MVFAFRNFFMCPHINKVDQRMPVKNNKGLVIKIRCPLFARKIRRNIVLLIQISIPEKVSFVTNGSWEKDTENGAPRIFFGPSYFETALLNTRDMASFYYLSYGILFLNQNYWHLNAPVFHFKISRVKKNSRCTVFGVFFSAASCKKRHRKRCTRIFFWPLLFCDGFI